MPNIMCIDLQSCTSEYNWNYLVVLPDKNVDLYNFSAILLLTLLNTKYLLSVLLLAAYFMKAILIYLSIQTFLYIYFHNIEICYWDMQIIIMTDVLINSCEHNTEIEKKEI